MRAGVEVGFFIFQRVGSFTFPPLILRLALAVGKSDGVGQSGSPVGEIEDLAPRPTPSDHDLVQRRLPPDMPFVRRHPADGTLARPPYPSGSGGVGGFGGGDGEGFADAGGAEGVAAGGFGEHDGGSEEVAADLSASTSAYQPAVCGTEEKRETGDGRGI